ncbi:hypothetical protein SCALM49S_00382 [Streptomyces californicus]
MTRPTAPPPPEPASCPQPYDYRRRELVEPDWRRLPGWHDVTAAQWHDVQWQRAHCVKNARQLLAAVGDGLDDKFYDDLTEDQEHMATMAMLITPQMLNTIAPETPADSDGYHDAFYADPVRRYMVPVRSDRDLRAADVRPCPGQPIGGRPGAGEADHPVRSDHHMVELPLVDGESAHGVPGQEPAQQIAVRLNDSHGGRSLHFSDVCRLTPGACRRVESSETGV